MLRHHQCVTPRSESRAALMHVPRRNRDGCSMGHRRCLDSLRAWIAAKRHPNLRRRPPLGSQNARASRYPWVLQGVNTWARSGLGTRKDSGPLVIRHSQRHQAESRRSGRSIELLAVSYQLLQSVGKTAAPAHIVVAADTLLIVHVITLALQHAVKLAIRLAYVCGPQVSLSYRSTGVRRHGCGQSIVMACVAPRCASSMPYAMFMVP